MTMTHMNHTAPNSHLNSQRNSQCNSQRHFLSSCLRLCAVVTPIILSQSVFAQAEYSRIDESIQMPKHLLAKIAKENCNPEFVDTKNPQYEYQCSLSDTTDKNHPDYSFSDQYSLEISPLIKKDFNQDGNTDYAVAVISSGPLGGSATTNGKIEYLLLDSTAQLLETQSVTLHAPF